MQLSSRPESAFYHRDAREVRGAANRPAPARVDVANRPPVFRRPLIDEESRTPDQVIEHYRIEKELADRLRTASVAERQNLYRNVYDELFRRVPHHQQLTRKATPDEVRVELDRQYGFLSRHVNTSDVLLEIGAGDGSMARRMAGTCLQVIAVDVSAVITRRDDWPANCEFRLTDGTTLPAEDASVDVVYSNQLMEHLHPDDALAQLREIVRVLRPGGRYVCVTPNRVGGPWDISMYFDEAATGLHLREYSVGELVNLFRAAGLATNDIYAGGRGVFFNVPTIFVQGIEWLLMRLPYGLRSRISRIFLLRALLGLRVVAWKTQPRTD